MLSLAAFMVAMLLATYVAVRRYRSRQQLIARVAELELLSEAGRAIVEAQLDVAALCQLIAAESGRVIDNQTLQIGLFERSFYQIHYWSVNGREQPAPQQFDLQERGGIVGWIRQSKQPLLVNDFEKEMDSLPARPRYISDSPPRSGIFIPLVSGDEAIGVIAAQSQQPNRFDEEDLRRLMILANQAAAAIAHARLFAQAEKRAAQLELVGEIGREISRVQSQDEIFEQLVQLTADTFGFHLTSIYRLNEQGEVVVEASNRPEVMQTLEQAHWHINFGEGLVGTAAATLQTVISNDTRQDPRFVTRLGALEKGTGSEMAIPLQMDGELLGVLDVQSEEVGFFTETEKITLEALASEISIAINKLQQLARQREQAWLTTAQWQLAEVIGHSDNLEEVLTAVARLTPMLLGGSFCAILLWEKEQVRYKGSALYSVHGAANEPFQQLQLQIGDWSALDAVHVGQEMLTSERVPSWLATAVGHSPHRVSLQPLAIASQPLGMMLIGDMPNVNFSHVSRIRREDFLQNIAAQTARAVETANLRTAQQEEAWVNTALFQVAATVNSLIDLNEILATIIRLIPLLVGVESVSILIWDPLRRLFQPGPSYGIGQMEMGLLETLAVSYNEMLSLVPSLAHEEVVTGSFSAIELPPWLEKVFNASSAGAFPLVARGELVGLILVGTNQPFSNRRLNILTGIAHQAATAVVNHQLYQEAAERDRLERELDVAREIQASLIPAREPTIPGCRVAAYWQAARQVSGDFYDFFELSEGKWGMLIADVADKGIPAALFMTLTRTILRTIAFSRTDPAKTLIRANEIITKDAQSDLFVTVFYGVWDPANELFTYANAGHNPPILRSANGRVEMLTAKGIALGVLPEVQIERKEVKLCQGDTLVLYTDGVTEAMNEDYDEFGLDRLRTTLEMLRQEKARDIVKSVIEAINTHAGDTPQFDDITLVVVKR